MLPTVVTLVAIVVATIATEWRAPAWLEEAGTWISIGFLALPGICEQTGLPLAWRRGVPADMIEARLRADSAHRIKAVCVVQILRQF